MNVSQYVKLVALGCLLIASAITLGANFEFPLGGFGGLSALLEHHTSVPLIIWYFLLNLGVLVLAAWRTGWVRLEKHALGFALSSLFIWLMKPLGNLVPLLPPLYVAIASGILAGAGITLTMHANGSSGGLSTCVAMLGENRRLSWFKPLALWGTDVLFITLYSTLPGQKNLLYGYIMVSALALALWGVGKLLGTRPEAPSLVQWTLEWFPVAAQFAARKADHFSPTGYIQVLTTSPETIISSLESASQSVTHLYGPIRTSADKSILAFTGKLRNVRRFTGWIRRLDPQAVVMVSRIEFAAGDD